MKKPDDSGIRHPLSRRRVQTLIEGESMTQQQFQESSDINFIVERYQRTGTLPPARHEPIYDDVTGLQGDLTELAARSTDVINRAQTYINDSKNRQTDPPQESAPTAPAETTGTKEAAPAKPGSDPVGA